MKQKSLGLNAILNVVRTLVGILFPLITYPYITRVLGAENLGKINFSNSVIAYFLLIAGFGVSTYSVREGAKRRHNSEELSRFVNEIFTINLYTTALAYLLLFIWIYFSYKLHNYWELLLIQSISIFISTIGVEWINTIFEDFLYITIRSIIIQILSVFLIFVFVNSTEDIYIYTWISILTSFITSVINIIHCRKYISIRIVRKCNAREHFKPMLILFFANISTVIFVNSDQTMMGYFTSDYYVGIYAVAVKIYTIVKNVFTSLLIVAVPRVSSFKNRVRSISFANHLFNLFLILLIPMAVGLFSLSDEIIFIIGGPGYEESITTLKILSVSILCSGLASFMTYICVVPSGSDKILLISSSTAAIINFLLNLILIPILKNNGAAITTVIAEFIMFAIEVWLLKPKIITDIRNLIQVLIGCLAIIAVCYSMKLLIGNFFIRIAISLVFSVITYFVVLLLVKNQNSLEILNKVKRKMRHEI